MNTANLKSTNSDLYIPLLDAEDKQSDRADSVFPQSTSDMLSRMTIAETTASTSSSTALSVASPQSSTEAKTSSTSSAPQAALPKRKLTIEDTKEGGYTITRGYATGTKESTGYTEIKQTIPKNSPLIELQATLLAKAKPSKELLAKACTEAINVGRSLGLIPKSPERGFFHRLFNWGAHSSEAAILGTQISAVMMQIAAVFEDDAWLTAAMWLHTGVIAGTTAITTFTNYRPSEKVAYALETLCKTAASVAFTHLLATRAEVGSYELVGGDAEDAPDELGWIGLGIGLGGTVYGVLACYLEYLRAEHKYESAEKLDSFLKAAFNTMALYFLIETIGVSIPLGIAIFGGWDWLREKIYSWVKPLITASGFGASLYFNIKHQDRLKDSPLLLYDSLVDVIGDTAVLWGRGEGVDPLTLKSCIGANILFFIQLVCNMLEKRFYPEAVEQAEQKAEMPLQRFPELELSYHGETYTLTMQKDGRVKITNSSATKKEEYEVDFSEGTDGKEEVEESRGTRYVQLDVASDDLAGGDVSTDPYGTTPVTMVPINSSSKYNAL